MQYTVSADPELLKQIQKFLRCSPATNVIGLSPILTQEQYIELEIIFKEYPLKSLDQNDRARIANFIYYQLDAFLDRFRKAKTYGRCTLESFKCLYGEIEGTNRYNRSAAEKSKNRKSKNTPMEDFIIRTTRNKKLKVELTDHHLSELKILFDNIKELGAWINDWDQTICCFINYGLSDYLDRIRKIKELGNGSNGLLEYHHLRYGEIEGKRIYLEVNRLKNLGAPSRIEHWISKGYSIEEAKIKTLEHQRKAGKARGEFTLEEHRKSSVRCFEYWIEQGCTPDEAEARVTEIQATGRLENFIKRYGEEEGRVRWSNRQEKWLTTMKSSNTTRLGISMIANELFEAISKILPNILYGDNEKIIRTSEKLYRVDCILEENNKIIEFFGDYWHANPNIYGIKEYKNNQQKEEIWEKDANKIRLLKEKGYDILIIWEQDYNRNKNEVISKCINFLR
jgi:hypothetical protein